MYKILCSLAITSCSAERCLSRTRIVRNRLRSTTKDDWFSSLTILACQRDIVENLRIDDIINNFATMSSRLGCHLL